MTANLNKQDKPFEKIDSPGSITNSSSSILSFPRIAQPGEAPFLLRSFTSPQNYESYVHRTNEKTLLHDELARAYYAGELPIRIGDVNKKVLDLGCGLGSNTSAFLTLFKDHDVYALDRSIEFLNYAESHLVAPNKNLITQHAAFEDFSRHRFDIILCSHVLQYIDTQLTPFLKKIVESLTFGGEAWIVLQEERGVNQLIQAGIPFLDNPTPYFVNWFVHGHVRKILLDLGVEIRSRVFLSHFRAPSLNVPTEDDNHLLNFILLNGFNPQNRELVAALTAKLNSICRAEFIPHEVGVTKFRRLT